MGRTLQVCSNFSIAGQNIIGVSMFSETILTLIIRFHWELMDVPILPLKNFAINLLEPQTILDYSVSHHWLSLKIYMEFVCRVCRVVQMRTIETPRGHCSDGLKWVGNVPSLPFVKVARARSLGSPLNPWRQLRTSRFSRGRILGDFYAKKIKLN